MVENRMLLGPEAVLPSDCPPILATLPADKKVIMVPGQPGSEFAGIETGPIRRNLDLLQIVRQARPDDFIIFLSPGGGKSGKIEEYLRIADLVQNPSDFLSLLPVVEEVHTFSSLRGLDAIIRQKNVYTYGWPFYAGWGLSVDMQGFPRRGRPLTVDMLLAVALIGYPSYYDWHTRMFCGPEEICRLRQVSKRYPLTWGVKIRRKCSDLACMIQGARNKKKRA